MADVAEAVLARSRRVAGRRGRRRGTEPVATSPMVTGTPEHTLTASNDPAERANVSAARLAAATSVTCTKSRVWRPSSNTRGGCASAKGGAPQGGDARIRGAERQSRSVDVVVAQRHDDPPVSRAQRRQRCSWPTLVAAYTERGSRGVTRRPWPRTARPADRAGGSKMPRVEIGHPARPGPDVAVLAADGSGPRRRRPSSWPERAGP